MKKEYLKTYKIVNIVIVCLVIYIYFFPQISIVLEKVMPNSTKCVYLTITGKPCPLCGGTRYIKNIKKCFYDITYLYNFFGGAFFMSKENKNYLDVVMRKIADLVIKRRTATPEEQVQINAKLDKLYDVKFTMLEQGV